MRNILMICGATLLFAACKGDSDLETKKDVIVTDTSSMYNSNASSDTGAIVDVVAAPPQRVQVKTVTRTIYVDRPVAARRRTVRQATPSAPVYREPNNNQGSQNTDNTGNTNNGNNSGTGTTGTTTAPAPAPVEKDKGWSNSTKGAVIGGVGGAIGGAILSRKKGKGAIIGGVVGAAGGYILGRKKDKRDSTQ